MFLATRTSLLQCFLCLTALFTSYVDCVAVMSVDLGSEWMKVAIVSPGVPMEIALNKESKRKTPVAVAFRGNERSFGEDALNVGVRFPSQCYVYFVDLLGKDINNPVVKLFQKRFPYYDIIADPVRKTILFRHDDETVFSPEELVAMLLTKARDFAVDSARQAVNDVVLTVPGYFNQAERKSMIIAAEMAGLKVLQLINDYTAAALNYGIFRRKDFNETAQYVMMYDMGAYSTSAVILSYQMVKTKEKGYVETNPQLAVTGVGYDRTLGGLEMQLRLRDFLGKKFNEMKKTSKNVFDNPRALAKLFKEAGRLKIILSANQEYYAQVEGLIDEIDFKLLVTREEFESLCKDLFDRVKAPVERALRHSQLSMDVISQVILVGAGTRVPAVQDLLTAAVKTELSKNLNTDEAAVLGAAYKAADLSNGFKVKKFITKDAVLFPIQVTFERSDNEKETRHITRTLFNHMNPYPQKKILTFNKHHSDFEFDVHYGDLENAVAEDEIAHIGPKVIHRIKLIGVSEAIKKHEGSNVEPKGIKTHFSLDESGLITVTGVEYHVEKTLTPEELAAQESDGQSTFSKLSSTISKLFQAAEEESKDKTAEMKDEKDSKETDPSSENMKPVKEESGTDAKLNVTETFNVVNKTDTEHLKLNVTTTGETEKKPKIVLFKEPISSEVEYVSVPYLSGDQLQESIKKINALNEYDQKKYRRESALNALESAVIEIRGKINDKEFSVFAKPDEAEIISNKSHEIAEWLEEEGYIAEADILESKLQELMKIITPVHNRYDDYTQRPDILNTLEKKLNSTTLFLSSMKNFTEQLNATTNDPQYTLYTTVEINTLEKMINDTVAWREVTIQQQEKLAKSDDPVLNIKSISEKIVSLDREVAYLINKSKNWRGPPPSEKGDSKTGEKTKKTKKTKKAEEDEKDKTKEEQVPPVEEENLKKETESEAQKEVPTTEADDKSDSHVEL